MKSGTKRPSSKRKPRQVEAQLDREERKNLQVDLRKTAETTVSSTAMVGTRPGKRPSPSATKPAADPLHGVNCSINAVLDLGRLMKTILDQSLRLVNAERGVLFLGNPESAGLVPVMAVNVRGEEITKVDRVSRTVLNLAKGGITTITADALADPHQGSISSVKRNKIHSIICAPLVSINGQVGAIYLDAPSPNAFPEEALPSLRALGETAAVALENARLHGELARENAWLKGAVAPPQPMDRLLGPSAQMESLRQQAAIAALMDQTVLIVGEPGTGRRLLASAIHEAGQRARGPFVSCDCSSLLEPLISGALLGRVGVAVRGAFGGEPGLIRQADRGTLYLSEVGCLEEGLAGVLGRVVERGIFRPLGGRRDERVDVRLILATRPDPDQGGRGRLPKSLSGRLQELQLIIPPLRERPEDIPVIALDFLRASAEPGIGRSAATFTPAAIKVLQQQLWPGNVRDLHQVLRRILLFHAYPMIDVEQVREALASIESDGGNELGPWSGKTLQLRDWEKEAIRQALLRVNDNKAAAARLLGIHRNTLVLKIKAMGLPS